MNYKPKPEDIRDGNPDTECARSPDADPRIPEIS